VDGTEGEWSLPLGAGSSLVETSTLVILHLFFIARIKQLTGWKLTFNKRGENWLTTRGTS
jgi:hypothetical protein